MFLDSLKETEKVLVKYQSIQSMNADANTLLTNLAGITNSIQDINLQLALSKEAKATLVPMAGIDKETAENLYSQLSQLSSDLEDSLDVTESNKALAKQSKEFREAENKKWKEAVESKATSQCSLLQELGRFSEDPYAASTMVARLKMNLTQMPKDPQAIRDYGKVLQNAENVTQQVGGTPAVMSFIHKVTSGQAVLSDLTDEIKAWIEAHHMANRLKISL